MVAHPFLSAVCSGQIETVATLLKDDRVDVNQRNKYNQTALLIASNHKALVAELLKHDKIDVEVSQDNDGHTAFTKATSLIHYTDSVAELLKHQKVDTNLQDKCGATALMSAAFLGKKETVAELLKHEKVDANLHDHCGDTAHEGSNEWRKGDCC
jgi:ankyrin repeat protein